MTRARPTKRAARRGKSMPWRRMVVEIEPILDGPPLGLWGRRRGDVLCQGEMGTAGKTGSARGVVFRNPRSGGICKRSRDESVTETLMPNDIRPGRRRKGGQAPLHGFS